MNSRNYLDYNATSPLSQKVTDFLGKGDLPFANPASVHTTGKAVRSVIDETKSYIRKVFNLLNHDIVFNSGATESINTVVANLGPDDALLYCSADHPAVLECACMAMSRDVYVESFSPDRNGNIDVAAVCKQIESLKKKRKNVLLNFTWVHNETGVVWPLSLAAEIKNKTACSVHVDAVQAVGKISNWQKLEPSLDAYSFSAHKFGALKGVGFTLVKDGFPFKPLIVGGGQQNGLRSGTENVLGVKTVALALEDTVSSKLEDINALREKIELLFQTKLENEGEIVGQNGSNGRASNTSLLLFKKHQADFVLAAFDLQGLDVSMGSACSSDSLKESHVLKAMGIEPTQNAIRLSLGMENLSSTEDILTKCERVFKSLRH